MKRSFIKTLVTLSMMLAMIFTMQISAGAKSAPSIEKIEHKGGGRIEVDFYGDVMYKNSKITVKDTKGKKYSIKNVYKDDDEVEFTIKKFKKGRTYKITISGIKERGTKKYGKRTGQITIPGSNSSGKSISSSKAIDIAKKHAKNKWGAKGFWDVDWDRDYYAGQSVWEVDFNGTINGDYYEFEYEIAVKGGKVLRYHREWDD